MKGRHCKLGDVVRIAKAAIRDHTRRATHHQSGNQNSAGGCRAGIAAAIDNEYRAGRAFVDPLALRMIAILKDLDLVEILARRDVAQRDSLSNHRQRLRIERINILNHLVTKTALEKRGCQRGCADLLQLVAGLRTELPHVGLLPGSWYSTVTGDA